MYKSSSSPAHFPTLESQNESWDLRGGSNNLLTEGLSQQKGFNSLIIESTILGRWEIYV